jgi:hypothetical protein
MANQANPKTDSAQIDRFKELARELGCDEDEAAFDAAVKKLSESKPLPKHEPKKRVRKDRGSVMQTKVS